MRKPHQGVIYGTDEMPKHSANPARPLDARAREGWLIPWAVAATAAWVTVVTESDAERTRYPVVTSASSMGARHRR
jgi:hypothetical protein